MKKNLLIILIITIPIALTAQEFMTVGEVFDFEVGDEFHIEGRCYYQGNAQPPNADRITIIEKYFSNNNDTVYYVRYHDSYYVYVENDEGLYRFWTETDTVSYTNLDTCITKSSYWALYDSTLIQYDTINEYSEYYCDSLINGYFCAANDFEPIYFSKKYGKGLGEVRTYHNISAESSVLDYVLFYYKKNGISCGTPDTTVSIVENEITNYITIGPIPAKNTLSIKYKHHINIESIQIHNISGQGIKQFAPDNSQLDISNITPGIYLLTISSEKGKLVKKIVIE